MSASAGVDRVVDLLYVITSVLVIPLFPIVGDILTVLCRVNKIRKELTIKSGRSDYLGGWKGS
jgi:hypothetical protein